MSFAPDPALPLPPATFAALASAVAADGPLRVPTVAGVPHAVVVRWLYRRALGEGWFPLVQLDDPPPPDTWAELDEPGWLAVPAALPVHTARLVLPGGPPVATPSPRRWLELDRLHDVATDPALAAARRSLGAQLRGGEGSVAIGGPPGSGRHALIRLLWLERGGDAPLVEGPDAGPDAWAVFDGDTDADAVARRLRPRTPPQRSTPTAAERPAHPAFAAILGESPALAATLRDAVRFARSSAPILLLGEPGVGKELLARALHAASGRRGPFEAIDLSAVPRDLVESELFGHVRGAFTGAVGDRPGAFRRADGGTLLLDELGNLDAAVQVKLLRVLQERVVRPVGGERAVPVDVRVLAATNADLAGLVARGTFRLDLLHRLDALTLRLPPLRERPEDVVPLALRFAAEAAGGPVALDAEAEELLQGWSWPGNIRELWGVMHRAVALAEPGQPLGAEQLDRLRGRHPPTFVLGPTRAPVAGHVELPTMADRGVASRRHLVRAYARGRLLRADAVHALADADWASLRELRGAVEALVDEVEGPIDRVAAARVLPGRIAGDVLLLDLPDGTTRRVPGGVAFLGRAAAWRDLEPSAGDRRAADRLAALRALAPDAEFVSLPGESGLSRVQALLRVVRGRVHVEVAPDAAAAMSVAGPEGEEVRLVAPAELPDALRLVFHLDRRRRLVVAVFAGDTARARHGAALRGAPPVPTDAATVRDAVEADRVWALDPAERAVLNDTLLRFPGGDMSAHLRATLDAAGSPRLAAYIGRVRPTQYCARLYENPANTPLVDELRAALAGREVGAWVSTLPGQLARVLAPRLGA